MGDEKLERFEEQAGEQGVPAAELLEALAQMSRGEGIPEPTLQQREEGVRRLLDVLDERADATKMLSARLAMFLADDPYAEVVRVYQPSEVGVMFKGLEFVIKIECL